MVHFFTIVLLICAVFFGVSYVKIIRAFRGRLALKLALAGVVVVLMLMPFAGMMLEQRGHFALAWPLATIGFVALVAAGWFCALSLAADFWNGIVLLICGTDRPRRDKAIASAAGDEPATDGGTDSTDTPPRHGALLPPGWTVIAIATIVAVGVTVGVFSAFNVQPRDVVIPVPKLPDGRRELVVAQVSDLHLGLNERGARMRQVIAILERVKPDMIVLTGDNIDSPLAHVDPYAEAFTHLQAPLGKYAILGNHEFYVASRDTGSLEGVEDWYRRAGFQLLRQEAVRPAPGLLVAGVDDPGRGDILPLNYNERAALAEARADDLVVFLKHRPLVNDGGYWAGQTMVQLSGHSHGGQIWPWHYVTKTQFPMLQGLYDLSPVTSKADANRTAPGRYMYVSPGAGTWGPPLRLFANPEVTILRFQVTTP